MKISIYALFALLMTLATGAKADHPVRGFQTIDLSLRSYHFNDRCYDKCSKPFNEANYGVGVTFPFRTNKDVSFGFLKNSFGNTSFYGVVNLNRMKHWFDDVYIKPGLALGLANGYSNTPIKLDVVAEGIVPIVSPNVSLYTGKLHFNLGILPSSNTIVAIFRAGVRF